MIDPAASSTAAIDQARLDTAMAAAAAERANRPRGLIVGAMVLLVFAVGYLLYALTQRGAAQAQVAAARRQLDEVRQSAELIQKESAAMAARGTAPDNAMVTKLEALVTQSGLTPNGATISEQRLPPVGQTGMSQRKYSARYANQDPSAILRWLELTQTTIKGLEITRLRLTPASGVGAPTAAAAVAGPTDKPGWNVEVEFSRWEKTS